MVNRKLFTAYICQQKQLGFPDYILNSDSVNILGLKKDQFLKTASNPVSKTVSVKSVVASVIKKAVESTNSQSKAGPSSAFSRLSSLRPVDSLIQVKNRHDEKQNFQSALPDGKSKRNALKELFTKGCSECNLAKSRNKWVFGAGNADAPVMVIGETPGVEEDAQGLPFVGAAGQLLTSMLAAIKLDRNKDLFITNVLKCRPPENRSLENSEIQVCMPLLIKQIEIIQPKAILLLGSISARAVLGSSESIANLRSKVHDYRGIPVMVIYHPADLLHNSQYKRPAWEDLQKFQQILENLGIYGSSKQS